MALKTKEGFRPLSLSADARTYFYLSLQVHFSPHAPDAHLHTPFAQQSPLQVHAPSLQQPLLTQSQGFLRQQPPSTAMETLVLQSIARTIKIATKYCFIVSSYLLKNYYRIENIRLWADEKYHQLIDSGKKSVKIAQDNRKKRDNTNCRPVAIPHRRYAHAYKYMRPAYRGI